MYVYIYIYIYIYSKAKNPVTQNEFTINLEALKIMSQSMADIFSN